MPASGSSATVDEALQRNPNKHVLSIQSHVVHGYAGNKCAVYPLQLHGFEVDFVNSVQFSNHAGNVEYLSLPTRYAHVKGQRLNDQQLSELYEGLKLNDLNHYSHVLTGYCGDPTFLNKIADIVKDVKEVARAEGRNVLYVCDPVMGDNGRYYVPRDLLPIYRDVIVPLADILTPNAFELGELTGSPVRTEAECLKAVQGLHERGVKTVVVTSGVEAEDKPDALVCYASQLGGNRYRFAFPRLIGQYVGTGDLFTSLLIVQLDVLGGDLKAAVTRVLHSMQKTIRRTSEYAQKQVDSNSRRVCELRLIESRRDILSPHEDANIEVEEF